MIRDICVTVFAFAVIGIAMVAMIWALHAIIT